MLDWRAAKGPRRRLRHGKAAARSSERHKGAPVASHKPETNEKRQEHSVGFSALCQVHAEAGRILEPTLVRLARPARAARAWRFVSSGELNHDSGNRLI